MAVGFVSVGVIAADLSPAAASLTSPLAALATATTAETDSAGAVRCCPAGLMSNTDLRAFYQALNSTQQHTFVWRDSDRYESLLAALEGLSADGLDPAVYGLAQLKQWQHTAADDAHQLICRDLLASSAYLQALNDLRYGFLQRDKVAPLWRYRKPAEPPASQEDEPLTAAQKEALQEATRVAKYSSALATAARAAELAHQGLADLDGAFAAARPQLPAYHRLRDGYRAWQQQNGATAWPLIESGPSLKIGMSDPRVAVLRRRLGVDGPDVNRGDAEPAGVSPTAAAEALPAKLLSAELLSAERSSTAQSSAQLLAPEAAANDEGVEEHRSPAYRYDEAVVTAVKTFQHRHGLEVDGVVGPQTRAALNQPRDFRRDQLRINLERLRWLAQELSADVLLVDIAAARVQLVRRGELRWDSRSQVGTARRETPSLTSQVTHLTFNPSWVVPPTIYRQDKLPAIRRDPSYLVKNRLRVLNAEGRELNPADIDWRNPGTIVLRQLPGPNGALGTVAIRFPNPFAVYLHDTPNQQLFERSNRTFSSGCVRVEGAPALADLLFEGASDAVLSAVAAARASGQTRNVSLPVPLPVVMDYWTAAVDGAGEVMFRVDIYQRDSALIAAFKARERALLAGQSRKLCLK